MKVYISTIVLKQHYHHNMKTVGGEKKVSITFDVLSEKPKGWDKLSRMGGVYHTGDFLHHFFPQVYYFTARIKSKLVGGIPLIAGTVGNEQILASLPNYLPAGPISYDKKLRLELIKRLNGRWFVSDYSGDKLKLPSDEKTSEIIYFKSHEEWFKRIDEDARNQVRQASRRGVFLGDATAKEITRLDEQTALRHGRSTDKIWTDKLVSFAEKHGTTLVARRGKRALAFVILFKHGTRAYLIKNASATDCLKYRPNHFLYSEAVRWAVNSGCNQLNTGGAEFSGLVQFKRSLGSKPFKYYWYHN
jgi:hypothetical protein